MRGRVGFVMVLIVGCAKAPASPSAALTPAPAATQAGTPAQAYEIRFTMRARPDSVVKLAQLALGPVKGTTKGTSEAPRVRGNVVLVATRYTRELKGAGGQREVTVLVGVDRKMLDSVTYVELAAWANEVPRDRSEPVGLPARPRPTPTSRQGFTGGGDAPFRITPKDEEEWLVLEEVLGMFLDNGAQLLPRRK